MAHAIGWLDRFRAASERLSIRLDRFTRAASIALILFMTAEVILAVIFRYVLLSPLPWGVELARLVMVWIGMLGIAIALRDGDHIGMDTLLNRLHGRALALCMLVSHVCVTIFLVFLAYWGWMLALQAWGTRLPALQIPWTWPMLAVPFTAVVQLVHMVPMILEEVKNLLSPGY